MGVVPIISVLPRAGRLAHIKLKSGTSVRFSLDLRVVPDVTFVVLLVCMTLFDTSTDGICVCNSEC